MPLFRAQVELQPVSALPEDVVVNTWHFNWNGTGSQEDAAHDLNGVLATAYTRADPVLVDSWPVYVSPSISRVTLPKIRTYSIDVNTGLAISEPYEDTFASFAAPANTTPLPREVALCMSYHGNLIGVAEELPDSGDAGTERDRPASRMRGRLYFGPFNANTNAGPTEARPGNGVQEVTLEIARYILSNPALLDSNDLTWVVYSRKARATTPVTGAWMDNEWDIQRRRGLRRTNRKIAGTGLG